MTWDCQVQDVGELSLINYVISCSLKWLGQSSDASGDGAALDGQHIPHQREETPPDRPGRCGCPVKGCRKGEESRTISLCAAEQLQTLTKRTNDTAKTRLGDNWLQNPGKWRSGTNRGNREHDSGPGHSTPEKCLFIPQKRQTTRNPHSQPASHSQQTLIYPLRCVLKKWKKSWSQNSPSLPWTPLGFWKEKETCP